MKCNYCGELLTIDDSGQCSNCGLPRYNPDEARECMEKLNQKDTPRTDAATIDCGWDTTQPVVPKTFSQQLEIELDGKRIALAAMGSIAQSTEQEKQELRDALSALIYTAQRVAELITSASDRYDIDVAIESAKEVLK